MINKMTDVNIPWGYHTMVKKLEFHDGEFFIGKFIRKDDGYVSWHMHESNGKVLTGAGIVTYEKEDDNSENDEKSLKILIKNFEQKTHIEFATLL